MINQQVIPTESQIDKEIEEEIRKKLMNHPLIYFLEQLLEISKDTIQENLENDKNKFMGGE